MISMAKLATRLVQNLNNSVIGRENITGGIRTQNLLTASGDPALYWSRLKLKGLTNLS